MVTKADFFYTSSIYSKVYVNGKTYVRAKYDEGDRADMGLRMKPNTAAIVSEYNTPTVTVEVGNTDRFGSEQIEIRYVMDGRLAWRAWDYEPDFESGLHTELAYHNIP